MSEQPQSDGLPGPNRPEPDNTTEADDKQNRRRVPLWLIVLIGIVLLLCGVGTAAAAPLVLDYFDIGQDAGGEAGPSATPSDTPTPVSSVEEPTLTSTEPATASSVTETPGATLTATQAPGGGGTGVCGNGVCNASENSDICPADCACIDNGVVDAGEGCGCRDVLCEGETSQFVCGSPCSGSCGGGLSCLNGVCWDACLCDGVCGPPAADQPQAPACNIRCGFCQIVDLAHCVCVPSPFC